MDSDHTHFQQFLGSQVLASARTTGAVKNVPRDLAFWFYTDTWDSAHDLREYLKGQFHYELEKPYQLPANSEWTVHGILGNKVTLSEEFFESWVEQMNIVSERFNARFDGWEYPLDASEEEVGELIKGMKAIHLEEIKEQ